MGRADGGRGRRAGWRTPAVALALVAVLVTPVAAASPRRDGGRAARSTIPVVAAENQYGDVVAAVGGRAVSVTSILRNPAVDPHTYETSVRVAQQVASARLVVQNGLGYDTFLSRIEAASPSRSRQVIDVGKLLRLPASTRNPHLWYAPSTMPAVAAAVGRALIRLDPGRAARFRHNVAVFDATLAPWRRALARLHRRFAGAPVATTEPVADDLVAAAGLRMVTPWAFQADVMNGVDPSPQLVQGLQDELSRHRVRALLYNVQVTDPLTTSLLALARRSHVPTVAVYETMPSPGFHYGRWMTAETHALEVALADGRSTGRL